MEARFKALNISAERIEAATPVDVTAAQHARYCNPTAYKWQSKGELACGLSHLRAMQAFLETRAPYAAIFEDDAILSPSLTRFLNEFETAAPVVDLLRLETDHARLRMIARPELVLIDIGIYRLFSAGGGSAGYIVSRHGAEAAIFGEDVLFNMTDQALFNPYSGVARSVTMRQISPALVVQENRYADAGDRKDGSDLETLRIKRMVSDGSNALSRLHYNIFDFFDRDLRLAAIKAFHQHVGGAAKRYIPFKAD